MVVEFLYIKFCWLGKCFPSFFLFCLSAENKKVCCDYVFVSQINVAFFTFHPHLHVSFFACPSMWHSQCAMVSTSASSLRQKLFSYQ